MSKKRKHLFASPRQDPHGTNKPMVSAIAAIGRNRELGKGNQLLWRIPDDMVRFKTLTTGHPVILGRKTFESILGDLGKPLPGRTNIVVTHNAEKMGDIVSHFYATSGRAIVVSSVEQAIEKAKKEPGSEEIFICGGAQVYAQALPYTDKLYLTLIEDSKDADSFFPEYEHLFTKKIFEKRREFKGLEYRWVDLERG